MAKMRAERPRERSPAADRSTIAEVLRPEAPSPVAQSESPDPASSAARCKDPDNVVPPKVDQKAFLAQANVQRNTFPSPRQRREGSPINWEGRSSYEPLVGLDKGLCAEPTMQCWRNSLGSGSRKQRIASPGGSGELASCLSTWVTKMPPGVKSPMAMGRRQKSPGPGALGDTVHSLHHPDNVPLGSNVSERNIPQWSGFQQQRHAVPHRPEEELNVDKYSSIRIVPEYYGRTSSPVGRDMLGGADKADSWLLQGGPQKETFLVGKNGLLMGATRRARSTSPPRGQEGQGYLSKNTESPQQAAGEASEDWSNRPTGPKGAVFHAFAPILNKRHVPIPGDTLPEGAAPEVAPPAPTASEGGPEAGLPAEPGPRPRAAGVESPRYDPGHGVFPRSTDDAVFRAESKFGSKRFAFHSQASTSCSPSSSSREVAPSKALEKGLSSEPTVLCWEAFLGERRRKAHGSPWASPGSSPWASPTNSPRRLSPPNSPRAGTPPSGGAPPAGVTTGYTGFTSLPSWSLVAPMPDAGSIPEAVESSSPLPTWGAIPAESRTTAVTMHRQGSPVTLGTPAVPVVNEAMENKYRVRDNNGRKMHASSKGRWK